MRKPLTDTEAAAVEKRIGRPLSVRERMYGELETRVDNRTHSERFDDSHWKPKKAEKPGTIYDDAVASAQREADLERFNQLSPAQKRLALMQEAQARELEKQAEAVAMKEHLAKYAPQLAKLRELQDAIRLDASWESGEAAAINRAITQIEAGPLADAAETAKLTAKPFEILAGKKQALRDQSAAKRAEIEATMATLDAELAALKGNAADARAIAPELANLKTSDEAWDYYVKNFDPNVRENRSPEHEAASERWYELLETERAAASQQQAAT